MKKLILMVIAIIVIGGGITTGIILIAGNGEYTFETVEVGVFEKLVEVSGKVAPIKDAHLGFEASGTVKIGRAHV